MPVEDSQFISQIDLKVPADWDGIRKAYWSIKERKNAGHLPDVQEVIEYQAQTYSLGNYGCMLSNTSLTSEANPWDTLFGKIVEKFLPQHILSLRDEIKFAGLNFINFGYYQHVGSIKEHIDGKKIDEGKDGHCNVNFIVDSEDPNAMTFAYNDNRQESYQSIPNTTWLLNTEVVHGVNNTGRREVFQIKIYNSFGKVKKFFQEKNMLL